METEKGQVVESEGVIPRDENGDKMDLGSDGVPGESGGDVLQPHNHHNSHAMEGGKAEDHSSNTDGLPLQNTSTPNASSHHHQSHLQRIAIPKSPSKHQTSKQSAAATENAVNTHSPQQPQATPGQTVPQNSAQAPQQTPDGKAVKRGRGGRRIGAGRKRKVDSIAKGEGSPTASPSQAKTHNTSQTSPSGRHPLHGNLPGSADAGAAGGAAGGGANPSASSTTAGKPTKKKKLYDELADGVKNSSRQLKFGYTILYVKEVEKTVEFYERAFGLKRRFVHESKQYAEMDTGVTALSFASNELAKSNLTPVEFRPNEPTQLPPGMEIAFSSFVVQRDYKRAVDAGAKSVSAPKILPWGQIVAYVRDLNGVLVEIASTSAASANK